MHLVNVIHRLNLFLFDCVVGIYNEILKQKQVTVLLIFPFYENLEDLETLGFFFFFFPFWKQRAGSEEWLLPCNGAHTLHFTWAVGCTYLCCLLDHCMHLNLPPQEFQRTIKTRFPLTIPPLSSFAALVQNSVYSWMTLLHSPSSRFQPFYWQINHPLSLNLFVITWLVWLAYPLNL